MPRVVKLYAPRDLRYEPLELSPLGPTDVRLRTRLGAISAGTEGAWYFGTDPQLDESFAPGRIAAPSLPRTLGYEKVATVTELGAAVTEPQPGQRVIAAYGHAEAWTLPADRVIPVPDDVSDEHAVACSLATVALHAVRRARLRIADDVFVSGQGFVGLMTTRMARLAGAGRLVVSDPIARRRALALAWGADAALDPAAERPLDAVRRHCGPDGVDVAFETSSSYEALGDALAAVRRNGRVCVVSQLKGSPARHPALGLEFHLNEIELISSDGRGDVRALSRWYFDAVRRGAIGDVAELVTHRVPFGDLEWGFELLEHHAEEVVKILVEYS